MSLYDAVCQGIRVLAGPYTLYSVLCTLHSVLCTPYSILFTLYSILDTLYSILTPYSILHTLYCEVGDLMDSLLADAAALCRHSYGNYVGPPHRGYGMGCGMWDMGYGIRDTVCWM